MDPRFEYLYLREVEAQCSFARNAYRYLESQLKTYVLGPTTEQSVDSRSEIFRTIHSFLTHTGIASKILWPGNPGPGSHSKERKTRMELRGSHLRKTLNLPNQGHPLENRKLRNYLEHFDEELDAWAADKSGKGVVALDNLGPANMIQGQGLTYIRFFNTVTYDLIFLNESVNLQKLDSALKKLLFVVISNKESALAASRKRTSQRGP